jgi:hypothetical protein
LFAFSGAVDAAILSATVHQVARMAQAARGRWWVDIIAVRLDGELLRDLLAAARALRRAGLRVRLAVEPPPRVPRVRVAPPAIARDRAVPRH